MEQSAERLTLTADNYYTPEADRIYMSCSQYQDFLRCEAAAMAKLWGLYQPSETDALVIGNYLHTAMESAEAHAEFCEAHAEKIFKMRTDRKTGETVITGKYAAYEQADKMIARLKDDPTVQRILGTPGENEKILTGELFGMPWKVRFDRYLPDARTIIDWKTAADLGRTEYNPKTGERESFLESLGYLMRAAVYTEIERQNAGSDEDATFIIVAVSKQDPPDIGGYVLNHRERYDYELEEIKKHIPRIQAVRTGRQIATRCGRCEWCRMTKKIGRLKPYYTLSPAFAEEKEEEYGEYYSTYLENAQNARL